METHHRSRDTGVTILPRPLRVYVGTLILTWELFNFQRRVTDRVRSGTSTFTARRAEPLHYGHHIQFFCLGGRNRTCLTGLRDREIPNILHPDDRGIRGEQRLRRRRESNPPNLVDSQVASQKLTAADGRTPRS